MLGPEQWEWLEKELRHSHAQVNLLMSGSQVLGVDALYRETWDPKSMQRLLTLIASSKASGNFPFELSERSFHLIVL